MHLRAFEEALFVVAIGEFKIILRQKSLPNFKCSVVHDLALFQIIQLKTDHSGTVTEMGVNQTALVGAHRVRNFK